MNTNSLPRAESPPSPSRRALGLAVSAPQPPARDQPVSPKPATDCRLLYERAEEPTADCPMLYREQAFTVDRDTTRQEVETLLKARFDALLRELGQRPAGKYIQLAAFDHAFEHKPAGPPVAVLMFKDWRSEGPVFTFYGPDAADRQTSIPPAPPQESRDLIAELFEVIHELFFVEDIVAGADFVRGLLQTTLESPIGLIHVFDLNTGEFVVLSQWGLSEQVLLHKTPDRDPFIRKVMADPRATRVPDAARDPYFREGRFEALASAPQSVVGCRLQIDGRYLGLVELATLPRQSPFSDAQVNALEYISEQLAEFFRRRPIVIDPEMIADRE